MSAELHPAPAGQEQPCILRGFAAPRLDTMKAAIAAITASAPFRNMVVPGGRTMSVAMTNCGAVGWVTDTSGYRYVAADPLTGRPWPAMPPVFLALAEVAAREAGYGGFAPDCCLINRYVPGARMALHQDRDERDFAQPIVSVSLGLPAIFLFGGARRADRPRRIPLLSGDVIVWGGAQRLAYHGVAPLPDGEDPGFGRCRLNLTFRRAR